jgi:hypothetical protein
VIHWLWLFVGKCGWFECGRDGGDGGNGPEVGKDNGKEGHVKGVKLTNRRLKYLVDWSIGGLASHAIYLALFFLLVSKSSIIFF